MPGINPLSLLAASVRFVGIAVFDINETTLDLAPVRAIVDELVGSEGGFRVWFQRLLQLSMTTTAVGDYKDFTALAADALEAVAATGQRTLQDDAMSHVGAAFGSLRAYPDVAAGLAQLRDAGWQTLALTNSAPSAVESQLAGAELDSLFDHIVSVEVVRSYKPAPAPYRYVADLVGADASEMVMVACHDWDLAGARSVGYQTAFVARAGMSYANAYPHADYSVADFGELASALGAGRQRS